MQSLVGTQLQTLICSEFTDPSNRLKPCNKPWATPFLEPLMVLVALGPVFISCLFLNVIYASCHLSLLHHTPSVNYGDYIATATMHFFSSADVYALQCFALRATSMITALFCLGSLQVLYSQFCRMQHRIIWPGWWWGPSLLRYHALLHSKLCEYTTINYFSTLAVSTSPPINMFSILQSPLMALCENLVLKDYKRELDCCSE